MLRTITEHYLRPVTDLSGIWRFAFLGAADLDALEPAGIRYDDVMAVPGCFDATPAYAGKRGVAAYLRTVRVPRAARYRLVLEGVHHLARVFACGREIGRHVGGFTRFSFDIADSDLGPAADTARRDLEIVVVVDNRLDYGRCPLHLDYFDWYHYGGIARGAELHSLGPVSIDGLRFVVTDLARRELSVRLRCSSPGGKTPLRVLHEGKCLLDERVELAAGEGVIERRLSLAGSPLWSPESPALRTLHVHLGGDDMVERIGMRTVATSGRDIVLNGEPVKLLGFNRHEAHPEFGHSIPEGLMTGDLQHLRRLGCNFIRGSHYPQDGRFLDLCDELGFLVWEESVGWQHTAEHLSDPRFIEAQKAHMAEMVEAGANHPCVILWGLLNESESHRPGSRRGYEILTAHLRSLDPTRPLTFATCHPFEDLTYDLLDVISVNAYPGWYSGELDGIEAHLDRIMAHVDASGCSNKPFILSEVGAEGLYGWRDWNETRWSEQYQARLLEIVIRHLFYRQSGRAAGLAIWQFCDLRTSEHVSQSVRRGRGFNNKGIVDEYRRPKLAYETVATLFRGIRARRTA